MKNDDSFSKQIDDVLSGKYNRFDALKVCDTPRIFLDAGLQQLPILYTQNHLKDALHEKSADNPHWHGLSIEQIKKVPKLLESPVLLMDSLNNDDSIVAVLSLLDNDNAPVFATIKPNGNGIYNSHKTDSNFMLSIYGKEKGFEYYIKRAAEENKILYWNKEKSQEIQCAELLMAQGLDSLDSNKILHQTNSLVNKTTSTLVIDSNQAARIKAAREIKENMPNLSENERAAAIAILEAGAKSQKMSISEYMEKTFPNGIFGDIKKAENSAKQQGIEINGAVSINGFGENVKAVIYASKTADFSTWCHELSHIWQSQLTGELKQNAEEAFQVKNSDWQNSIYTFEDGHADTSAEAFAYGFEDFLKHKAGEMATEDKKAIFEKFADYMSRTYNGVKQNIKINEEIAKVYEKFLQLDDNILAEAEKAVRLEIEQEQKINKIFNSPNLKTSQKVSETIGLVSDKFADLASRYGYDIKGYSHTIDNFFVSHALKQNGNKEAEEKRGNIAITHSDICNVFSVYTHPDYIIFGTKTKTGNHAIVYVKNIGDSTIFVEDVRSGKKELAAQTLYKKSGTIDVSSKKEAPELYAHSDPESISIVDVKKEFVNEIENAFLQREIKIPQVESFQTRSHSNSNNITDAKNVNISFQPVDSSMLFQSAYHGSSANFDKFNTSEYGMSGDGAMAFGYGVYVSNSETIARSYAGIQGERNLYSVEIPDGDYIVWDKKISNSQKEKVKNELYENLIKEDYKGVEKQISAELDNVFSDADIATENKTLKTRSEYLQGKTELSDIDIINILDLPVEKRSINNEIYTDKSYKELKNNPEELSSLTENLKTKPEYLKYHSSYIAKSKLLYQESDVLCNEIPCLIVLNQLKKTSYLLPYEYAKNKNNKDVSSADSLKSDVFTDFKRVFNGNIKYHLKSGVEQGKDIFFLINNKKLSHDEIKSQLIRFSNNRTSENKEGTYLFFSEKDFVCYSFGSDKNGFITELPEYDLKQIRLANVDKPLHPTRSQTEMSATSSDNINLPQNKPAVKEVFQTLLLRGEITLLERKKDIENRNERYLDAVSSLEKLTLLIQSDAIKESNNKFVKKHKESRFYKDVQNLFIETSNQLQEKPMEKQNIEPSKTEFSNYDSQEYQQKKLATQMILDQEDREQMEAISATIKSATKDFMDLNTTPITEIPFKNADPEQIKELHEQAEAIEKMQQETAANAVIDENGNTHYQETEEKIDFLKTPTGNKSELSENEWKFSHSSEFKELYGDWEGKIKKDFLLSDDTVSQLTGNEFGRKEGFTLTEQVEQYFNEMNNSVESPFFGKVVLDKNGADDSLSHGMGRLKAVAYAGVPDVIKKGVIIDSDSNHKNRGYNSYVIAAPIKIADKNYICEVVLKQNKQENRFYLHEVTEQKKFLERAFVTNSAQKPAHQGTLSNILEKTVSVNYEISCPMSINGEPEKIFVQNEYRKSLNEFQSKNQNTAIKTTDSVKQEENEKSTDILELQDALKVALKETAVPLEKIDFTRENYNKLFPYSKIETPIEIVKMGANQFEKLEKKERQDILQAVHDTLKNPDLIINEHRENISEKNEDNHIYAKSFLINDKVYGIQSVVVSIDGENVSISTHERNINNIVNKIKKPDQLLFAAAKVRLSVERITGEQLVTVNPSRENEYVVSPHSNIQQNSGSVKQEENPSLQMEPGLIKKFNEMKKAIESREKQETQTATEKTESAGSKKAENHEKPKVDLIKKAAKDFISAIKNGTAPFLNSTEKDFGKISLRPAAIVNASNGLPFSGEAQLLAQIYYQQQKMKGEIVTTFEGAKESGTFIANKPESKKNFVLANKTEQQQKEIIQKTRYFMPEACDEPDKIYAHALQKQRPQKISDYRDLIRHFENIPNGQKEISDLRIRIAHEHLKEIQSRFAMKKERILTVDEINERKKILQDYFKNLPEKHRESEKNAFENTFGLTLNPEEIFKTNLEGNFKNKKFEDVVKSNEKLTDQANRKLSSFIQKNSMEDKKLSEILHEEYNAQSKEEKETSKKLKIEAIGISEPETYLGKYLAACNANAEFVTDEDTIKAVQSNLVKKLEENYRVEKYGILKEIGQQAQRISNETTSKIAFDKAHSNKNTKEKKIEKEIGPIGMGN